MNMSVRSVTKKHEGLVSGHLENLKLANPEQDASSMTGVTIFSIISVNTVKVGSTMKSINPAGNSKHAKLHLCTL